MADMSDADAGPARRHRTPSTAVERELVTAAEAVLVRDGPGGLTVRAVAAEAGIAHMAVYSRLGSKDGLVNALLIIGFQRLRAVIEAAGWDTPVSSAASNGKPDMLARLRDCGTRYRDFALANPHFYAIMFEDAIPHEFRSPEVWKNAKAAFDALARLIELTAVAGQIAAPDPVEAAQQFWSAVHGAVALEFKGAVMTPDPSATYSAFLDTILRGLAPDGPARPA